MPLTIEEIKEIKDDCGGSYVGPQFLGRNFTDKIRTLCDMAESWLSCNVGKRMNELAEENARLQKQLNLALHVINCIPENQLNELADQQLQALKKEMGEL